MLPDMKDATALHFSSGSGFGHHRCFEHADLHAAVPFLQIEAHELLVIFLLHVVAEACDTRSRTSVTYKKDAMVAANFCKA